MSLSVSQSVSLVVGQSLFYKFAKYMFWTLCISLKLALQLCWLRVNFISSALPLSTRKIKCWKIPISQVLTNRLPNNMSSKQHITYFQNAVTLTSAALSVYTSRRDYKPCHSVVNMLSITGWYGAIITEVFTIMTWMRGLHCRIFWFTHCLECMNLYVSMGNPTSCL